MSIRLGKYFLNVGTIIKLSLVAFFLLLSVVIYGVEHGVHGYSVRDYAPSLGGFLAVTPVLLFAVSGYVGRERRRGGKAPPAAAGGGRRREDPGRSLRWPT